MLPQSHSSSELLIRTHSNIGKFKAVWVGPSIKKLWPLGCELRARPQPREISSSR
jgi:hypothetical protein